MFSYRKIRHTDKTDLLVDNINKPHMQLFKSLPLEDKNDEKKIEDGKLPNPDLYLFEPSLAYLYWIDEYKPSNRVSSFIFRGVRRIAEILRSGRAPTHFHREYHPDTKSIYLLYKDGVYQSFIWHATKEEMAEAVRAGIVKCYSVTGKAISALGKYIQIEETRIAKGYISNRYPEKHALLQLYQDRLDALHTLEALVNKRKTPEECQKAFDLYKAKLMGIQAKDYFAGTMIDELDKNARANIRRYIGEDILEADKYNNRRVATPKENKLQSYLVRTFTGTHTIAEEHLATGIDSVLTFVKQQMFNVLREMQGINQNMSYSMGTKKAARGFAATRGDLNSCAEDAVEVALKHTADPHNAMTLDHHGLYQDGDKGILYDSVQQGLSKTEHSHALLAIANIKGFNKVTHSFSDRGVLSAKIIKTPENGEAKEQSLKIVKATKWYSSGGIIKSIKKLLAWPVNVASLLFFGMLDIVIGDGLLVHVLNNILNEPKIKYPRLSKFSYGLNYLATMSIEIKDDTSHIVDLRNGAQYPLVSIGRRIAHYISVIVKNSVVDIIKGLYFAGKELSYNLIQNIRDDIESGNKDLDHNIFNKQLIAEMKEIETTKLNLSNKIVKDFNNQLVILNETENLNSPPLLTPEELAEKFARLKEIIAAPEYILTDGDWHDVLNAAVHGTDEFMSLFMHHIYAKHPFAGLLFSISFATGGFAILAPHLVGFLGAKYIAFSAKLGEFMAKQPLEAAMAGGSTQAEILAPIWELMINGPESWLVSAGKSFERDPATAAVYTFAAVGFGGLLAYGITIPGLTPMLLEGMGTFPAGALLFAGAKVGLLVVELVQERDETGLLNAVKAEQIREELTVLYGDKMPVEDLKIFIDTILSEENITKLMERAPYKQLLEVKRLEGKDVKFDGAKMRAAWDGLDATKKAKMENQFERENINTYLSMHSGSVQDLSRYTRHHLSRRIDKTFIDEPKKAESLKTVLYPEEHLSILLVTLDVLATFVSLAVRIAAGVLTGFAALFLAPFNVVPAQMIWKPILSALSNAGEKLETDFTRLFRAFSKQVKTNANFIKTMYKALADVFLNSLFARPFAILMGALGLYHIQHTFSNLNYRFSAWFDVKYEAARQLLSTAVDWFIRDVTKPHPVDTRNKISSAHVDMYLKLGKPSDAKIAVVQAKIEEKQVQIIERPVLPPQDQHFKPAAMQNS